VPFSSTCTRVLSIANGVLIVTFGSFPFAPVTLTASRELETAMLAVGVAEAEGVAEVLGVAVTVGEADGLPQAASASTQARAGIRRE